MPVTNMNTTENSMDNSSRLSNFGLNMSPFFRNSHGNISLQLAIAVTVAASPPTICLNIFVIVAVLKIRKLQTNSNILIASLAVVDLLVGAVSMPMAISVDTLTVEGTLSDRMLCTYIYILYTTSTASFYHLILIAWERHVAIARWTKYKVIVTKKRVKRYAGIAWITAILTVAFHVIFTAPGTQHEVALVIKASVFFVWLVGISLMAYFYRMVYIETRKLKGGQISRVSVQVGTSIERKIGHTMLFVTVAVLVCIVPFVVVFMLAHFFPFLRSFRVFRWVEISLQLNSLVNPAIYFFRNNRYRNAALKFLRLGKPKKVGLIGRNTWGGGSASTSRRRHDFILSWRVGKFVDKECSRPPRRSQSFAEEKHRGRETPGVSKGTHLGRFHTIGMGEWRNT